MSVRSEAKSAVKEVFRETQSMWINLEFIAKDSAHYDPRYPDYTGKETRFTVRGVEDGYKAYHVDGDKVQRGDRRFYVDPDTFDDIKLVDSIAIDGLEYQIVSKNPIQQDVLLELQLRSGG